MPQVPIKQPKRVNVLGVGVDATNMDLALDVMENWIRGQTQNYVCIRDVHGVVRCQHDQNLRCIHREAGLVTPDGMPLVWFARWAGFKNVSRVYGPDLMLALCERSISGGYKHFLYGGGPRIAEKLGENLQQRFSGLRIVGTYSPPFRPLEPAEDDKVVNIINVAGPDIVWVGLSTPKQEEWMAAHVNRLDATVLIGAGAAFDFHAGVKKQAPRCMQRSGFEWLFRLLTEPRRLGVRYCTVIPLFALYLLMQVTGLRKYSLDQ